MKKHPYLLPSRLKDSAIGLIIAVLAVICPFIAAEAGKYTFLQCEGSLTPYPDEVAKADYPDSLTPVFINHVGRHGARYPASDSHCLTLQKALKKAISLGTITTLGRRLDALNDEIIRLSNGQWGDLDSLGKAEQRGIAMRMKRNYPKLFAGDTYVDAISSYSPRCIASMEAFLGGLTLNDSAVHSTATSGKQFSYLMRPFDINQQYLDFRKNKIWEPPYTLFFDHTAPSSPIRRVLGKKYPFKNEAEAQDLALIEYYVLAGCSAMSLPDPLEDFFSRKEANALWSCFNLRQYLQRTATEVSDIPAEIAKPLVENLISTTEEYISGKENHYTVRLRFGHAETIMPLVSLLRLPGCYYLTDDYSSVSGHWKDFDVVPMASNVQFIVFEAKESGRFYVRILLNERPLRLHPEDVSDIYPWTEMRAYLLSCIEK